MERKTVKHYLDYLRFGYYVNNKLLLLYSTKYSNINNGVLIRHHTSLVIEQTTTAFVMTTIALFIINKESKVFTKEPLHLFSELKRVLIWF